MAEPARRPDAVEEPPLPDPIAVERAYRFHKTRRRIRQDRKQERALARLRFFAILLDVMMPGVDGWEMLRRMQESHGMGSIPVIMFSGQVDSSDDDALARGAQGFLGKPFNPQDLIARTKELLRT